MDHAIALFTCTLIWHGHSFSLAPTVPLQTSLAPHRTLTQASSAARSSTSSPLVSSYTSAVWRLPPMMARR